MLCFGVHVFTFQALYVLRLALYEYVWSYVSDCFKKGRGADRSKCVCQTPAVYNVNYLLNKKKCLDINSSVSFIPERLSKASFEIWGLLLPSVCDCPLLEKRK